MAESISGLPLPETPSEVAFQRLIDYASRTAPTPRDVAALATHLSNSGARLDWPHAYPIADVASTGGPASLSTLLTPLFLRAGGLSVVKLAVPGRPAGAIDSLGTIAGYRTTLDSRQVRRAVETSGYAHFLADARFAPMDAALFAYRKRVSAVALPLLVAASLLAKKLAVGVKYVGLDVRIGPHGNFGRTFDEARANARLFCEAASAVGLRAIAFISNAAGPAQPFVGRGEALRALAIALSVQADRDEWLLDHVDECRQMASAVLDLVDRNHRAFTEQTPLAAFENHLTAQGSSLALFERRVAANAAEPTILFQSRHAGPLVINLEKIREILVRLQAGDQTGAEFADPAGMRFLAKPGDEIFEGSPLAQIRCPSEQQQWIIRELASALTVGHVRPAGKTRLEIVSA